MKISRQEERRLRFQHTFGLMPLWETWETTDGPEIVPSKRDDLVSMYDLKDVYPANLDSEPPKIRHHCKSIPRRVRRDMARKRSLREFRVDHNLPEPKGIGVE